MRAAAVVHADRIWHKGAVDRRGLHTAAGRLLGHRGGASAGGVRSGGTAAGRFRHDGRASADGVRDRVRASAGRLRGGNRTSAPAGVVDRRAGAGLGAGLAGLAGLRLLGAATGGSSHGVGRAGRRKELLGRVAFFIEARVERVEVLRVEVLLGNAQRVAEPLEMHDFAFPQELDRVAHVGIVGEAQDVVVGLAGLLLGREVLVKVGKGVAGDLELGGREGVARGGLRVDARGVVDKVGVEAAALDLFGRHAAGELVDDRGNHLDVGELFGARIIYMTMEDA